MVMFWHFPAKLGATPLSFPPVFMSDCSSAAHFLQCSRPTLEDNLTFHLVRVKCLKYTKPPSVYSMPSHCRPQCSRRLRTSGKAWFVSVSPSWFAVTQGEKPAISFFVCVCSWDACIHIWESMCRGQRLTGLHPLSPLLHSACIFWARVFSHWTPSSSV